MSFLTSSRLRTLKDGTDKFSPTTSPDDLRLEKPFGNLIGIFEWEIFVDGLDENLKIISIETESYVLLITVGKTYSTRIKYRYNPVSPISFE